MTLSERSPLASKVAIQVARIWSVYAIVMGIYWAAGGAGYPFGVGDPQGFDSGSILTGVDAPIGGVGIAAVGLVTFGLVWLLERATPRTAERRTALIIASIGFACGLAAVGVDSRAMFLVPPLGLFPIRWAEADWPTVFQLTTVVAAASVIVAVIAMARRTQDRSPTGRVRSTQHSRRWERIGRRATYVAIISPLPYAIIRLCWSRGWAVGAPQPYVTHLLRTQPENVWIEPILAGFAIAGAILTSGLLARWGRIFPSWIPLLGRRQVPLWFPLGLGGSAALAIWSWSRGMMLGRLGVDFPSRIDEFQQWGMPVSRLEYWGIDGLAWVLFPLWAVSLAVALAGYYHRRLLVDRVETPSDHDRSRPPPPVIGNGDDRQQHRP